MWTLRSVFLLAFVSLEFGLAIPSNVCIVTVFLEIMRKSVKLSPSDVIFLAKGMVNILLQVLFTLQVIFSILCPKLLYTRDVYSSLKASVYLLNYFSYWMTAWLSAHYCTSITNYNCGFFIWLKDIVSNFLCHTLFLTALGLFAMTAPGIWILETDSIIESSNNSTVDPFVARVRYTSIPYYVSTNFLGVILPSCLSLLCLLLTFSFLVRHVWRVKSNDSVSSRPNLQAHVTALRTILFLFLMIISYFITRATFFIKKPTKQSDPITVGCWYLLSLAPSVEAAIIFQAKNKLRRIIIRRFWTRCWRTSET